MTTKPHRRFVQTPDALIDADSIRNLFIMDAKLQSPPDERWTIRATVDGEGHVSLLTVSAKDYREPRKRAEEALTRLQAFLSAPFQEGKDNTLDVRELVPDPAARV